MSKQIFKMQASITTTQEFRQVLIYNEDRSVTVQIDMDESLEELFDGELKIYVEGEVNKDKQLEIHDIVEEQDW